MIWRAILGMCVCLALFAGAARGCTCTEAQPGTCTKLQTGDVAFLGTVTVAELVQPPVAASSDSRSPAAANSRHVWSNGSLFASSYARFGKKCRQI